MVPLSTLFLTTSCLNNLKALEQTLLSIVSQTGPFRIRYHVQDSGSTDGTLARLAWWQEQINTGQLPVTSQELNFSFETAPRNSATDNLRQNIELSRDNDFCGWLAPGDVLLSGALTFVADISSRFAPTQVSWISGASCTQQPYGRVTGHDLPLPRAAIQAGLCDGVHWSSVQSAGTFFRPWLWEKILAAPEIYESGDQAIWQMFAGSASLIQTDFALAATAAKPLLPKLPNSQQKARLIALTSGPLVRRRFDTRAGEQDLFVIEEDCSVALTEHHLQVFGTAPKSTATSPAPPRDLFRSAPAKVPDHSPLDEVISHQGNILAYDSDWQYPAVTEQHAFHKLRDLGAVPDGVTYIAYPWATLIDKLQRKSKDLQYHLDRFKTFCARIPRDSLKITTCQHIKLQEMLQLFQEADISQIFWTHTTHDDIMAEGQHGFTLHPFPLFPVQIPETVKTDRPHLFSFIGARANQHYLTQSRNWILDLLGDHPRGHIIGRGSWHYNRVVYDHQVRSPNAQKSDGDKFIDQSASAEFRDSLNNSLFSLCPSGSGPNSIRLWESLGAGAIPVILADSYAPPGNPALWQAAAVFCSENPKEISALPERLEQIAADPDALERMRHAGRQLWTLYGPSSFVYDIQKFMLRVDTYPDQGRQTTLSENLTPSNKAAVPFIKVLATNLSKKETLSEADAILLLQSLACDLLLNKAEAQFTQQNDPLIQNLEQQARKILPPDHATAVQLNGTKALQRQRKKRQPRATLSQSRSSKMRVCLLGKHSNRTPLSYAPFQALAQDRVEIIQDPLSADILLSGFNVDLADNAKTLQELAIKAPQAQTVILSEEPLWDSIWSDGFSERTHQAQLGDLTLNYHFLNHSNSDIFTFDHIPYFLLTNDDFLARYSMLIARHSDLSPQALRDHWLQAPVGAAFFAEFRDNIAYDKSFPDQKVYGLSVYRSKVAQQVQLPGTQRVGKGWQSQITRQALPDWHLDKLSSLDMQVRVMAAYENTHQHTYVSEKIFDAFVIGGIPTYYADAYHRVLDLVPNDSMINTFGLDPKAAAARISDFTPDLAFAESWLNTARNLQQRFTNLDAIQAERQRVTNTVIKELEGCLS